MHTPTSRLLALLFSSLNFDLSRSHQHSSSLSANGSHAKTDHHVQAFPHSSSSMSAAPPQHSSTAAEGLSGSQQHGTPDQRSQSRLERVLTILQQKGRERNNNELARSLSALAETAPAMDDCCVANNFCEDEGHTFGIPLINLSRGSKARPTIDGKIVTGSQDEQNEYSLFLDLPMFNGGKNGKNGNPFNQKGRIGTSFLAYDCNANIVCVAAQLDEAFLRGYPNVRVEQDDDESWIRFGSNNGSTKLKQSNAD
ncbi:hypothetical protein HJC23_005693, partial [Cyclotella cryptica]